MTQYILAIDQGTTSSRALLVDNNGNIGAVAQKEFTQIFPQPGWVEHDPMEIWQSQYEMITKVMKEKNLSALDLISLGITNQRETTIVWDRHTGEPVYNAIVWQDRRTAEICEQMKSDNWTENIRNKTGLVIDAYFSGTKVKWILDNVEGARTRAENGDLLFGTVDTWLMWKLSNGRIHKTDYTNASRTLLFNIKDLKWDEEILEYLNIPAQMLPEVQNSSSDFGFADINEMKVAIQGVAGDQQAALFGQTCFEPGEAKNTYGTGCFMLMNTGKDCMLSTNGLLTTIACNSEGAPAYALEGSVFIAGAAVQWLRDGLNIIQSSAESEEMAMKAIDNDEVVVVPAFAGLGAPYWDMYARGAIFGLTRDTGRYHIVKATLQSLAFQTKDVLDAMNADSGIALKALNVDGGACANNYLMQFQADILDVPVRRPTVIESTAMGAAYLAGIQAHLWKPADILSFRNIDREFAPQMEENKRSTLYNQWGKGVKRSMNWKSKDE